jgi:hypothetical protein
LYQNIDYSVMLHGAQSRRRCAAPQLPLRVGIGRRQLQLGGSFVLYQNIDNSVLSVLLRCVRALRRGATRQLGFVNGALLLAHGARRVDN